MSTPRERLSSALAGRYRLQRELGAGAMATVYLALDERHNRSVAIKVLKPELAATMGPERFDAEIKTTASLRHPHILPLFDSGATEEFLFYVMPYIAGETVRDKLKREKQLEVDVALRIAREVADALGYAHQQGIIHRDIKPENILLESGHAMVADFGIAKAIQPAASGLTQAGLMLGTPAYVAPEQVVGDPHIDGRADLYSLGCVLYEMLAGTPPFGGATGQAVVAKRFIEPVPQLRVARADAPEWVEALLLSTMATDPELRPANASAFSAAIDAGHAPWIPSSGTTKKAAASIAVLPFANLSSDPENEYFSDGIAEDLINALAQLPDLKVIARTSAFSFRGKNQDVRDIGRALGVRHLLEGSVRRAGSALRVTAQLIDSADGSHLWSKRYDRTLADVFAIQDEITHAITAAVGGALLGSVRAAAYATDDETYDIYLRGRGLLLESSIRITEAFALISEATRRDPRFVPALVTLAEAHAFRVWWAQVPGTDGWPQVRALAKRVEAHAPDSAAAAWLRGVLLSASDRDFSGAEASLRRAVELNPSDVSVRGVLGLVLIGSGRAREGDVHNQRMLALDPLSPFSHVFAANNWAAMGNYAAAEAAASEAIALNPQYPEGYHMLGYTLNYIGRFREAFDALIRVPELGNRSGWPLAKRSVALAGLGRYDEVRRVLDEMLARSASEYMNPDAIACVCQLLGRNNEAFQWLELAAETQTGWVGYVGVDALFAPLRRDSRFDAFCQRHRIPVHPLPPNAIGDLRPPA